MRLLQYSTCEFHLLVRYEADARYVHKVCFRIRGVNSLTSDMHALYA